MPTNRDLVLPAEVCGVLFRESARAQLHRANPSAFLRTLHGAAVQFVRESAGAPESDRLLANALATRLDHLAEEFATLEEAAYKPLGTVWAVETFEAGHFVCVAGGLDRTEALAQARAIARKGERVRIAEYPRGEGETALSSEEIRS